jgi:hypothetical protein
VEIVYMTEQKRILKKLVDEIWDFKRKKVNMDQIVSKGND